MKLKTLLRRFGLALIVLGLMVLLADHLTADGTASRSKANGPQKGEDELLGRDREGSKLINQIGEFHEAGERISFYFDGSTRSFVVLENLALERISRKLDQGTRKWSVTGTITEFRGSNFLLVERALMKQRSDTDASAPRS